MRRNHCHLVLVASSFIVSLHLGGCAAPVGDEAGTASSNDSALTLRPCPACTLKGLGVVAPTNLAATKNPQVCAAHMPPLLGGLACEAALQSGDVVLVWNWADTGVPSGDIDLGTPDGFHVYASFNGGAPTLWATQNSAPTTALGVPAGPAGVESCFRVSAYKGARNRRSSNPVCVNGVGSATTTITLSPQSLQTCVFDFDSNGNYFVTGPQAPPAGQFEVGYGMLDSNSVLTGAITSFWDAEGAAFYDTSSFRGHTVVSATLSFTAESSANCTNDVVFSAADWIDNPTLCSSGLPEAGDSIVSDFTPAQAQMGLDVTKAVVSWANGMPNLGILVTPNDPDTNNEYCNANYSAPVLTVTYFP